MPYLIRTVCNLCGRAYRYSSDSDGSEGMCPFADCWENNDDAEDDE
jgi:hypothetical protein